MDDATIVAATGARRLVSEQQPGTDAAAAARHAVAVLLLTSIHHAYGVHVYDTPWRYHVVLISLPAACVIAGCLALLRRLRSGPVATLVRRVFVLTILVLPVRASAPSTVASTISSRTRSISAEPRPR